MIKLNRIRRLPNRAFHKMRRALNPFVIRLSRYMPPTSLAESRPVLEFDRNDKLIIDLGANDGTDTFFYLKKGFNVVAVEANPVLCARLERLFARFIREDRLRVINGGVVDIASRGPLDFYVNHKRSEWSSFIREVGGREGTAFSVIQVPTISVAEIFRQFGTPYYLKIDIEGFDESIVKALARLPFRPRFVSVEEAGFGIIDSLHAIGATGFKLISQTRHTSIRPPAKEGRDCFHSFLSGSSGPFGEETPGKWRPYDEFRLWFIKTVRDEHGHFIDDDWFDVHAKF